MVKEKDKQNYIIGVGTGRCGTKTLATLLNNCKNVDVSHEFRRKPTNSKSERLFRFNHRLGWYYTDNKFNARLRDFKKLKSPFIGDVASYYLNYIEKFIETIPKIKIIYLYRDIKETVDSFVSKTRIKDGIETNHWLSHTHDLYKSGRYTKVAWDICFPKYRNYKTKRELIRRYCEEYKEKMKELKGKYEKNIFSLDINILNEKPIQEALFNFIKLPRKYRTYQKVKENVGVYHE